MKNMKKTKGNTKKGTEEEFGITYTGTLDELKKSEFYRAIQNKKDESAFLEQLGQAGIARAIVGVNSHSALVLEAKRLGEKHSYAVTEVENPTAEAIASCVNFKEFASVWA